MPVDLALSTNTPTATLELRQLQPLGSGEHLATFLVVRSGAFAAALPFVFTRDALRVFSRDLDTVWRAKTGEARLVSNAGGDMISFAATEDARLRISGDLHDVEDEQHLRLAFWAEWEGIAPLADGLRKMSGDHA